MSWLRVGFLSKTSLEGYIDRLVRRVEFFNGWISGGLLTTFWLPGFFNHHSFISALKQNFARKQKCSVDEVEFEYNVMDEGQVVEDGAYGIHGLHLEGGRWDANKKVLAESLPKVQYSPLPTIQLRPRKINGENSEHPGYKCPVYVTQVNSNNIQGVREKSTHLEKLLFLFVLSSSLSLFTLFL